MRPCSIMPVNQMNRWIHSEQGFIASFDLPWSERSQIADPDPDHPKGTHPKTHNGGFYKIYFAEHTTAYNVKWYGCVIVQTISHRRSTVPIVSIFFCFHFRWRLSSYFPCVNSLPYNWRSPFKCKLATKDPKQKWPNEKALMFLSHRVSFLQISRNGIPNRRES